MSDDSGAEDMRGDLTQDMATLVNPIAKPSKVARPPKPPLPAAQQNSIGQVPVFPRPPIQHVHAVPPPTNSFGMTGMPLSPTPNGAPSFTHESAPTEASRAQLRRERYVELFGRFERRAECVDVWAEGPRADATRADDIKTRRSTTSSVSVAPSSPARRRRSSAWPRLASTSSSRWRTRRAGPSFSIRLRRTRSGSSRFDLLSHSHLLYCIPSREAQEMTDFAADVDVGATRTIARVLFRSSTLRNRAYSCASLCLASGASS